MIVLIVTSNLLVIIEVSTKDKYSFADVGGARDSLYRSYVAFTVTGIVINVSLTAAIADRLFAQRSYLIEMAEHSRLIPANRTV